MNVYNISLIRFMYVCAEIYLSKNVFIDKTRISYPAPLQIIFSNHSKEPSPAETEYDIPTKYIYKSTLTYELKLYLFGELLFCCCCCFALRIILHHIFVESFGRLFISKSSKTLSLTKKRPRSKRT